MSYGAKYKNRFYDRASQLIETEVHKKDYDGDAEWRDSDAIPVELNLANSDAREKLIQIRGHELRINMLSLQHFGLTGLFTSDGERYKGLLKIAGTTVFDGKVLPDTYGEGWDALPYPVGFSASCGLGRLKNYDFVQADGSRHTGVMSILSALMLCFRNLTDSFDVIEGINLMEENASTYLGYNLGPLHYVSVNTDAFYEEDEDETPWDCLKVVTELLKPFFAFAMRVGNTFYILRVPELGSSFYARTYAYQSGSPYFSFTTAAEMDLQLVVNDWTVAAQQDMLAEGAGAMEIEGGLKEMTLVHDYGKRSALFREGDPGLMTKGGYDTGSGVFTIGSSWTPSTVTPGIGARLRIVNDGTFDVTNVVATNTDIDLSRYVSHDIAVDLQRSGTDKIYLKLDFLAGPVVSTAHFRVVWLESGSTKYLNSSGGVSTLAQNLTMTESGVVELPSRNNDDNLIQIQLLFKRSMASDLFAYQNGSVFYSKIDLLFVSQFDEEFASKLTLDRVISEVNNRVDSTTVLFGDVPEVDDTNARYLYKYGFLYNSGGGVYLPTSSWVSPASPLSGTLLELLSDALADEYRFYSQRLKADFYYKDSLYLKTLVLRENFSRKFMVTKGGYNVRDCEHDLELLELSSPFELNWCVLQMRTGSYTNYVADPIDWENTPRSFSTGTRSDMADTAVMLIACLCNKWYDVADRLVQGLLDAQKGSGGFPVWCVQGSESGADDYRRSWNDALVAYALGFFLEEYSDSTNATSVETALEDVLDYLDGLRTGSGYLSDLVTAGNGTYSSDVFSTGALGNARTVDNILAWFALNKGASVLEDAAYSVAAAEIAVKLSTTLWDSGNSRFYAGVTNSSTMDATAPELDVYYYGYLFLKASGMLTAADRNGLLTAITTSFTVTQAKRTGDREVTGFSVTSGASDIWFTGTLLAALAHYRKGDDSTYVARLRDIAWCMEDDSSFKYGLKHDTSDDSYALTTDKCVGVAAWYHMVFRWPDKLFGLDEYSVSATASVTKEVLALGENAVVVSIPATVSVTKLGLILDEKDAVVSIPSFSCTVNATKETVTLTEKTPVVDIACTVTVSSVSLSMTEKPVTVVVPPADLDVDSIENIVNSTVGDRMNLRVFVDNSGSAGSEIIDWEIVDSGSSVVDSGSQSSGTVPGSANDYGVVISGVSYPSSAGTNYRVRARVQGDATWVYSNYFDVT